MMQYVICNQDRKVRYGNNFLDSIYILLNLKGHYGKIGLGF